MGRGRNLRLYTSFPGHSCGTGEESTIIHLIPRPFMWDGGGIYDYTPHSQTIHVGRGRNLRLYTSFPDHSCGTGEESTIIHLIPRPFMWDGGGLGMRLIFYYQTQAFCSGLLSHSFGGNWSGKPGLEVTDCHPTTLLASFPGSPGTQIVHAWRAWYLFYVSMT